MSTDSADPAAGDEPDPVSALRRAERDLEQARERVAEFGEDELRRLADAHDELTRLLDRYEEPATGDGDFQTFIEFQGKVESFVERLPEDLLLRESFEEADEHLQQRRLTESDFEQVRRDLAPVADLAARLTERDEALSRYREAYSAVRRRRAEVADRIDDLERLQRLGEADLDAPVERLRDPLDRYNAAVEDAFETYRRETPAREVVEFLADVETFPLVSFESPPADLAEYLTSADVGDEPIPRVLELAEYTRSKLDHYVADPDRLKRTVATQQTYFRRLSAEPLTVDWPPPTADRLTWRCRELTSVVDRFAPDAVEPLRDVAALPRREDYERLRESAVARDALSETERSRIESGALASELAERRAELSALDEALADFPDR